MQGVWFLPDLLKKDEINLGGERGFGDNEARLYCREMKPE
jgi:hypothetical protein